MILGLDISTSITGATILDMQGKVVYNKAWDTRKFKNLFEKAEYIEKQIDQLHKDGYKIEKVFIEQSLQSFRSGFSSAKTLSVLSRFNGIVSWMVYRSLRKEPEYIAATSARKMCGIKVPRGQKAKQVVLDFLLDNEPTFEIRYTKFGNPTPDSFDRADSLVIARAGFSACQQSTNR